jgi:hypothetical protein
VHAGITFSQAKAVGLEAAGVWTGAVSIGHGVVRRCQGAFGEYYLHAVVMGVYRVDRPVDIRHPARSNKPGGIGDRVQVFGIGGTTDKLNFAVRDTGLSGKSVDAEQAQEHRAAKNVSRHGATSVVFFFLYR